LFDYIVIHYNLKKKFYRTTDNYKDVNSFKELLVHLSDSLYLLRLQYQTKLSAEKLYPKKTQITSASNTVNPSVQNSANTVTLNANEVLAAADSAKTVNPIVNIKTIWENLEFEEEINRMANDSTDLKNCIMGQQSFKLGSIVLLQNYPSLNLPDDNPVNITQFFTGYTLPIRKIKGKLVCNYKRPRTYIWFRNIYLSGSMTPFNQQEKTFAVHDTLLNNPSGKRESYVNMLDLYQFARLKGNVSLNILSYMTRYYSIYGDASAGLGRTWITQQSGKSNVVNFLQYGFDFTLRTKFKLPVNLVFKYKLFSLDPNSNTFNPGLNIQYDKLSQSTAKLIRNRMSNLPYSTVNLTFQYTFDSGNKEIDPGSGSKGSDASRVLYFSLAYSTNKVFGKRYGLDFNNFFTFQVGYARSISEVFEGLKSIIGLKDSSGSDAKTKAE
jgi:hypothetical protein